VTKPRGHHWKSNTCSKHLRGDKMSKVMQTEMIDTRIIKRYGKSLRYPVGSLRPSHVSRLPEQRQLINNQPALTRDDTTTVMVFAQQRDGVVVEINTVCVFRLAFLSNGTA
jgi:hypothetical protein